MHNKKIFYFILTNIIYIEVAMAIIIMLLLFVLFKL